MYYQTKTSSCKIRNVKNKKYSTILNNVRKESLLLSRETIGNNLHTKI